MSTLKVPGANLYYEVSGEGPLLIIIPGAAGTGQVFQSLVGLFAERYQVVAYERRGFSRSKLDGPQDYDHRMATDADDIRRLIEQLTDKHALVFGNSSGATVALEVPSRYPERVDTVFAHEPPVVNLLPDAAKWIAFFDEVYAIYRQLGVGSPWQAARARRRARLTGTDDLPTRQGASSEAGTRYRQFARRASRLHDLPRKICKRTHERTQRSSANRAIEGFRHEQLRSIFY